MRITRVKMDGSGGGSTASAARGSLNKSYRSIFIFVVINNAKSDIVKRVFTTFVIVYSNLAQGCLPPLAGLWAVYHTKRIIPRT